MELILAQIDKTYLSHGKMSLKALYCAFNKGPLVKRAQYMNDRRYYGQVALIAIIALLSGCGKVSEPEPEQTITRDPIIYYLSIGFKDTSGADLVGPLDMKTGYKLDIVCPDINGSSVEGSSQFQKYNFYEKYPSYKEQLGEQYSGYCLFNQMMLYSNQGLQKTLTYRITSAAIFGDNSAHEIVTYWDYSNDSENGTMYPVCTKVVYKGIDCTVKKLLYHYDIGAEKENTGHDYYEYHALIRLGK